MKTVLVPLVGDPIENLYQLGLKEKDSFLKIEKRVKKLLSTSSVLSLGQDILGRARILFKKKEEMSFFDRCIESYSEGLGIDSSRYFNFLSMFEIAAHYGQVYPELKSMLPGCTSVFAKTSQGITHSRLLDFPLIGLFETTPRLYYWLSEGKDPILNYSCEGLAPIFFQGIHGSGMSFAIHHKPGKNFHNDGQSIFKIAFEALFSAKDLNDFRREVRTKISMTKWSFLIINKEGQVQAMDIDGPSFHSESYNVYETSPLIFTNIPLQQDATGFESYLKFSEDRQNWLKQKLNSSGNAHPLDLLTDVEDQKGRKWLHPAATLSTVGAYHVNLTSGILDLKEGESALVASDAIIQISLANEREIKMLKKNNPLKPFEAAWKRAALAQAAFDQGKYDQAYHELQMALALMPNPVWKEIFNFYLYLWDFKFVGNGQELSLIYKKVKGLKVPDLLKDQRILLLMRLERKLNLAPSVTSSDVSIAKRELFLQEKLASKPVFATWMKLLYPRLEILDVFSPHNK